MVFTDEPLAYKGLVTKRGYPPQARQSPRQVYVQGDVHTQTIEGFWSLLKRGIGGVYHSVSAKYLQGYIDEYAFRYNHRPQVAKPMFWAFLGNVDDRRFALASGSPSGGRARTLLACNRAVAPAPQGGSGCCPWWASGRRGSPSGQPLDKPGDRLDLLYGCLLVSPRAAKPLSSRRAIHPLDAGIRVMFPNSGDSWCGSRA